MKKSSLRFIPVLTILMVLVAGAVSAAPADTAKPASITVTGHAEATIVPDIAVVTTGIVSTAADVESARSENDRIMNRIVDALEAKGIDRKKITTSNFSLQPIYRQDAKDGGVGSISGYRLQNNVTIIVEDLSKTGEVIDAAFQAGANQFQGLRFGLKNDNGLKDELLKNAVQDGRRKAGVIATALGVNLGQPLEVVESGSVAPLATEALHTVQFRVASTPIEAGSVTLGMDVNMVFAI